MNVNKQQVIEILRNELRYGNSCDDFVTEVLKVCMTKVNALPDAKAPVPEPELEGAYPLVLYFTNPADVDEFIAVMRQAKPGLVARKL